MKYKSINRVSARAIVLAGAASLAGCASSPNLVRAGNPPGQLVVAEVRTPMAQDSPAFMARLADEQKLCDTNAQKIGLALDKAKKWNIGIATVGIVAGSIIVPALAAKAAVSKSAVAAWGGVSGAANAAQFAIGDAGNSPQDRAKNQKDFYDRVNTHIDTLNSTTAVDGEKYLWKLHWICANAVDSTGTMGPEAPKPVATTMTTTTPATATSPGATTTTTTTTVK